MAALDFPASPTNGQVYQNWIYSTSKGAWQAKPMVSAKTVTSDVAPSNPANGDEWLNTLDGCLYIYYVDVDGGQWVQVKNDASFSTELGPTVDALNAGGNTNYIINGAFDIWQRGTSFSASGYTADRWTGDFVTGAGTVSQQAFTPGTAPVAGYEGSYFLRRNVTTGAQFSSLIHRIEDVRTLAGQTVTLSFWAKGTNPTGNFSVNLLQNFGTGGSAQTNLADQALVLTNSWARYTYTFTLGSMAGKTIGTGSYLWLSIYQTAANTSASTLDIWGAQLQAGSKATSFHRAAPTLQGELAACQRYYYRRNAEISNGFFAFGNVSGTSYALHHIVFPIPMRTIPSGTLDWTGTLANYIVYQGNSSATLTGNPYIEQATSSGCSVTIAISGGQNGWGTRFYANSSSAYLGFSAEL